MNNKLKAMSEITADRIMCALLTFCVVFGSNITFGGVRVAGMVLTLYRVGIPLITAYYLFLRIKRRAIAEYFRNKLYCIGLGVFVFWFLYGAVSLFISPYSDFYEGIKDLLNVVLAGMTVYSFTECCPTKEHLKFFAQVIKWMAVALCVFGFFELIANIHLSTSRYASDYSGLPIFPIIKANLMQEKLFPSTAIFFGVNDFSAFLTIFFPLFLFEKNDSHKVMKFLVMLLAVFLIAVNDANICLVAMTVMLIAVLIIRKFDITAIVPIGMLACVQFLLKKWISYAVIFLKSLFGRWLPAPEFFDENGILSNQDYLANFQSLQDAILNQAMSAMNEGGSVYQRLMLMKDAFNMTFKTYLLGAGPASFTRYGDMNGRRSVYVDPHNWWLEILSQYGILVFAAYVGLLVYIFVRCVKEFFREKDFLVLKYLCIIFLYVICSIAPSSYMSTTYQWLVVGFGLVLVNSFKKDKTEN